MKKFLVDDYCYICVQPMGANDQDIEHVVPKGLFNEGDRQNLIKLPAHASCNRSFSKDDEYFRLCMTAAAPGDPQAKTLWSGPVMRGFHRPQSRGFKTSVLEKLIPANVRSESGIYLGTAEAMLQEPDRLHRVVDRIVRGLYSHMTGQVLPAEWPVSSDLMDPAKLEPFAEVFEMQFHDIGNGTFHHGWKHLEDDEREGLFWMDPSRVLWKLEMA